MKDLLEQLARKHNLELLVPISDTSMDSFEARAGFQLTPELRQVYRICGGLELSPWEAYILPFERACQYALDLRDAGFPDIWHYFPILDFNESNPICICCSDLMTGYVVQVYHDDVSYVKYRGIEALLADLSNDASMDWSLRTAFIGDSQNAAHRTSEDIETARQLLHVARNLSDDEDVARRDAFRFAFTLFSADHIDEIAPFIDYPDEYVTSDLKKRLIEINHPKAKQILQDARDSIHQFMEQAVEYLNQAHLPPSQVDFERHSIRLEPGPIYLNVPAFYAMRHQADFWAFFVERAMFLVEYPKFVAQCLEVLKQAELEAHNVGNTLIVGGSRRIRIDLDVFYKERQRPDFATYLVNQVQKIIEEKKKNKS